MRKRDRHQLIKKMITEEKLSTQKEIQDRLEAHNVFVTQTTLSRDLREIGLTKVKKNDMVYYVLANETEKIDLVEFLSHHLEGVARAEFTLVLHTKLGEASVLANIVDANKDEWILGRTIIFSVAKFTLASLTPGRSRTTFSTVLTQPAHCNPSNANSSFFITNNTLLSLN